MLVSNHILYSAFILMSAPRKSKVYEALTISNLHSVLQFTEENRLRVLHSVITFALRSFLKFILVSLSLQINFQRKSMSKYRNHLIFYLFDLFFNLMKFVYFSCWSCKLSGSMVNSIIALIVIYISIHA